MRLAGRNTVVGLLLLAVARYAVAATDVDVKLDHGDGRGTQSTSVNVEPGQKIRVQISNTCPDKFYYQSVAVAERQTSGAAPLDKPVACDYARAQQVLVDAGYCRVELHELSFVHQQGIDQYLIKVTRKADRPILGLTTSLWQLGGKGPA